MKKFVFVVLIFVLIGFVIFFALNLSKTNITKPPALSNNEPVTQPDFVPQQNLEPEKNNEYSFVNYPVKFSYSNDVNLSIEGDIVVLRYGNGVAKINPKQAGIGLSEPAPEITEQPLVVDGKAFTVNGQSIIKIRLYYSDTNETTYLINLPYSDSASRRYSVVISYEFENKKEDHNVVNVFDKIVASFIVN